MDGHPGEERAARHGPWITATGSAALAAGYALWFGLVPGGEWGLAAAGATAVVAALLGVAVIGKRHRVPTVQAPRQPPLLDRAGAAPVDLSRTLDHLPLTVLQTDAEGRLVYLSQAWEALCGHPAADTLGRPAWALLHPEDSPAARPALQRLLDGEGEQYSHEWRLLGAAGQAVWVNLRVRALVGPDGVAGLAGTLEEVTRRRLDERLQSQRGYVNALLANVPGLVYRSRNDRSYTMEFISEGCLELTGYEPEDLLENRQLAYGDLIHPEDREFVWTHIQAHLARRDVYQVAYRITDAAGRLRWVWEQGRGVFASQGELLAIEGFITDLSERRGAEEQAKRRLWFEARTGLVSRPIFDHLLDWSLDIAHHGGTPCAVLVIDLLALRERIERQGGEWGERALTLLARRLAQTLGDTAQATHLGQHRFAALVHDLRAFGLPQSAREARDLLPPVARLTAQLTERLAAPLPGEAVAGPGAAIGIAITAPRYPSPEALLRAAMQAAEQAADLGAGHCEFAEE